MQASMLKTQNFVSVLATIRSLTLSLQLYCVEASWHQNGLARWGCSSEGNSMHYYKFLHTFIFC